MKNIPQLMDLREQELISTVVLEYGLRLQSMGAAGMRVLYAIGGCARKADVESLRNALTLAGYDVGDYLSGLHITKP